MLIDDLLPRIEGVKAFREMKERLARPGERLAVRGLWGTSRAFMIAALVRSLARPVLAVTPKERDAISLAEDLEALLEEREDGQVWWFPSWQILPYDPLFVPPEVEHKRILAMARAMAGKPGVWVASLEALKQKTFPAEVLVDASLVLRAGIELDFGSLPRLLTERGYRREPQVEKMGEFSVRGGIVDVMGPLTDILPDQPLLAPKKEGLCLRIEFEGDTVSSLRLFDPGDQRSYLPIASGLLLPASELVRGPGEGKRGRDAAETLHPGAERFPGIEHLLPWFSGKTGSLLSFLPAETILWWEEPSGLERSEKEFNDTVLRLHEGPARRREPFPAPHEMFYPLAQLLGQAQAMAGVQSSLLEEKTFQFHAPAPVTFTVKSNEALAGNFALLLDELPVWEAQGQEVHFLCHNEGETSRLREMLAEAGRTSERFRFEEHLLRAGFGLPEAGLTLLSNQEIFKRSYAGVRRRGFFRPRAEKSLSSLSQLRSGDLVVHDQHGIGIYRGIVKLSVEGNRGDYLQVDYADQDKLYVPVAEIRMLTRYTGSDRSPRIHRLGGASWEQVKAKVKRSVEIMAGELLALYARRETAPGFGFSGDTPWEREFDASFVYEETPDQTRAITEIKEVMETPRPMDYLLCGDVGYGKTEVAMRAAFKAVMDKKQTAVLVPTTLLAEQHFMTFSQRFADYPVRIDMMSRFRDRKEQARTVEGLVQGTVDIVIGTHRLLQKDIVFKDLGLLIVDEEHRFGVRHKEKLKQLRAGLDVLSMTATPIPRTLHMALSGLRPMSMIATPPRNRLPIQTYVLPYREETVREAVLRELARGGQVFFVHNRVKDIDRVAGKLQRLVPEARIAVAHGQEDEKVLEHVMRGFVGRTTDVLVATAIIESGLDIPSANTLIVDRADLFGLAQLYQLRGRVGRSQDQAWAYLFYPSEGQLDETARKRLQAIQEFAGLGSGFKLALRDLEIRGAGNLLGREQHGNMEAVGFEMYCELLKEAVERLQGESESAPRSPERSVAGEPTEILLRHDAFLPDDYVPDPSVKIEIYERLLRMTAPDRVDTLGEELADRFGRLPDEAAALLDIARARLIGTACGLRRVEETDEGIRFSFRDLSRVGLRELERTLTRQGSWSFKAAAEGFTWLGEAHPLRELINLLKMIIPCVRKEPSGPMKK